MSKATAFFLFVALTAPASAYAQAHQPAIDTAELVAEHHQWEADQQRWATEHVALANRLRAAADAIELGDNGLDQHGGEISVHGAALMRGVDSNELAAAHARLRSEHEDARISHHELIEAVRDLEQIAREDETSRTIESNQGE